VTEDVRDERNLAGAIYGTILATSVVAGLSEGGQVDQGYASLVVLSTSIVFWIAHVYAGVLGHHLRRHGGLTWSRLNAVARHEWPILGSGFPPAAVLGLGTIGLFGRDTAYAIAIGVGIASLVLWGVAYAREQGYSRGGMLLAGLLNGLLGVLIVGLKVLVH
jgi:hypothetical protein